MQVTKKDNGVLVLDVPEASNVSSALAEARDVGRPLIFDLDHDNAVRLALLIAVIPPPDGPAPVLVIERGLLEELVHAGSFCLDVLYGTEAARAEETLRQAKELLGGD